MPQWLYLWTLPPIFCATLYLLLRSGIAVSKSIRALLFSFHPGKNTDKVTLGSCTGWVRHIGRFPENRTYKFTLDTQLSKGDAEVLLLDKNKQPLLKLNQEFPIDQIALTPNSRYYLRWNFKNATGSCQLRWQ